MSTPNFYRCPECGVDVKNRDLPESENDGHMRHHCGAVLEAIDEAWDRGSSRGQRRRYSAAETVTSTAIGLVVSLGLQYLMFPGIGHAQQLKILAIFTAASIARGYIVRRIFNRIHDHG